MYVSSPEQPWRTSRAPPCVGDHDRPGGPRGAQRQSVRSAATWCFWGGPGSVQQIDRTARAERSSTGRARDVGAVRAWAAATATTLSRDRAPTAGPGPCRASVALRSAGRALPVQQREQGFRGAATHLGQRRGIGGDARLPDGEPLGIAQPGHREIVGDADAPFAAAPQDPHHQAAAQREHGLRADRRRAGRSPRPRLPC